MIELLSGMANEGSEGHIGWFENRQRKLKEVIEKVRPVNLIEIGFNMGHSCKLICDTILGLKENDDNYSGQKIYFYVFDTYPHKWSKSNFGILKNYYKKEGIELYLIGGSTADTLEPYLLRYDGVFDFIEVDGSHDLKIAHNDILNVYNKVRVGGVIYIDDYVVEQPSNNVQRAVDMVDWNKYDIEITEDIFLATRKQK